MKPFPPKKMAPVKTAAAQAVGKHESNMHKGKPKTKLAGGGTCRGGGAATKGKSFKRNG